MSAKAHISAILITVTTLAGCVTTVEDPDEIITKREFYEDRNIENILLAANYFIMVFWVTSAVVMLSLGDHKVEDHGYVRIN